MAITNGDLASVKNIPRWAKVLSDLTENKSRTLLVVLSIAVGVFAVGMVTDTYLVLINSSNAGYARINPSSAFITVSDFNEELLEIVRQMPDVEETSGRRVETVRLKLGGRWYRTQLSGIDFAEQRLNLIQPIAGQAIPEDRQLLIDQTTLFLTDFALGDVAIVEIADGSRYEMPIVGQVRDLNSNPSINSGGINAYTTPDTFGWLGKSTDYNSLVFAAAERKTDYQHIQNVTTEVKDKIEASGWHVFGSILLAEPGVSPVNFILEAIRIVLGFMAIVSLLLSAFLVFNTMSALMVSQIKQIGIMKSIGASTSDLSVMYLVLVLIFGILAFAIAVFPAVWASRAFAEFIAGPRMLDLEIAPLQFRPGVIALQLIVSLLVPVAGAFPAIFTGTRKTVHEAISTHGLGDNFGASILDRMLGYARSITGPWILSAGNVLRNKQRVFLTLGTLVLGGAVFIGVVSVRTSAARTVDELGEAYGFDVEVQLAQAYRTQKLLRYAQQIPGVEAVEGWLNTVGTLVDSSGELGNAIRILAPPRGSELANPKIVAGRWLLPSDDNALVVDSSLQREYPNLSVGDTLRLRINGRDRDWTIVGIYQYLGVNFIYTAYTNYDYLADLTGEVDKSRRLQLVTESHDSDYQQAVAEQFDAFFKDAGVRVNSVETSTALRNVLTEQFNIVVAVLTAMALLITVVGGLGLAGTMGMSVMERNREIGVMRVVGAGDGLVIRIILVEGLVLAFISWVAAIILAWPVGFTLSRVIGQELVNGPLSYAYSFPGMVVWLILVLLTAAAASYAPARKAANLQVREVLAYE
jgi:putative ABC transport system permease protein